jgi:hypothetical protein
VLLAVREYGCAARRDLGPLATPLGRHLALELRDMKTYPMRSSNGTLSGFEVTSAWVSFRPLYGILRSVEGVADVRRHYFSDDRIAFTYCGEPFVVHEAWGDNSRYWVGPAGVSTTDITPLLRAFQLYQSPAARLWSMVGRAFHFG